MTKYGETSEMALVYVAKNGGVDCARAEFERLLHF